MGPFPSILQVIIKQDLSFNIFLIIQLEMHFSQLSDFIASSPAQWGQSINCMVSVWLQVRLQVCGVLHTKYTKRVMSFEKRHRSARANVPG